MCITTGVCGGLTGISAAVCSVVAAVMAGSCVTIGLLSTLCIGCIGAGAFLFTMAGMAGIWVVLMIIGGTIAAILADSTIAGYLSYLSTFITQGGNLYDALRICFCGK